LIVSSDESPVIMAAMGPAQVPWSTSDPTRGAADAADHVAALAAGARPRDRLVTKLDKAMLRMIDMGLRGTDSQPAAADIIRTSGNTKDGACVPEGGQIVTVL
jgi:hypothetical protein